MELTGILHRPESEYAFLYEKNVFHIRIRTTKDDIAQVNLISGDPYAHYDKKWYKNNKQMRKIASTDLHDYWFIETTSKTKRLAYAFQIIDFSGEEVFYSDRGMFPYSEKYLKQINYFFRMPYFHEVDRSKTPDWVSKTIWYQIFPERFSKGDASIDPVNVLPWASKENPRATDFYGGDLQGIIDKLDYLEELGINGIYLTPIFEAATNHKYDTINYKKIDPHFGDEATFRELVTKAHARGMRIMLDAVFNHVGYYSKEWQDVLENQEESIYRDWFHIHSFPVRKNKGLSVNEMNIMEGINYDTFAFTGHMPKLNTANPEVQTYLLDIATYWIREFDIDGWRLDVANEVDHQFWKKLHQACTYEKEDFYILGEIWHSGQKWLEGDEFHAVMNYAMTESMEDFFLRNEIKPTTLVHRLNNQLMRYRTQINEVQFNLLDSHDTARLLTKAGNNKDLMKAVLVFMFLQKGTPSIFYGTEIGLQGDNDPDCRKCMIWDSDKQDKNMLNFMKALIKVRKENSDLITYGEKNWEESDDKNNILSFQQINKETKLVAYFNQGDNEKTITYPKDAELLLANNFEQNIIKSNGYIIYRV